MPGLFGIISKTQRLSEQDLRSMALRMANSMWRVPWLLTEIWGDSFFCGGRVHLGVLNPEPQPLSMEGKAFQVWFDGEVYPGCADGSVTPSPKEVVELATENRAGLSEWDGVFAFACYNQKGRELILGNDRLGFRPIYYTETKDWFAYAAEVKALLAIVDSLPHVDEISLRQFFGFDYMLGERTWWKGIELIPPASVWLISSMARTSHQYWTFDEIRNDPRPEVDVIPEFGRLWSKATRQRLKPGTIPLLLSGGLDSRLLLAELRRQEADVLAITFGSENCSDMTIARQCARIAGFPHRSLLLTPENWWHRREEAIWQMDGLVNGMHFHAIIAVDEMHTGSCYTLINSTGDTLFGGSKLYMKSSGEWRKAPHELLSKMYLDNPFFSKDEVVSVSIEDCDRYLYGLSTDCFTINQRQRRFILTGPGALSSYCEAVNPGISIDLLQLLLGSLSDEQRIGSKFYNMFLVMQYPKYFKDVPWQRNGRGLGESTHTRIRRNIRTRFASFVGTRVNPYGDGFADYSHFLRASKTREKLLQEDLIADDILNGRAKRALANSQSQPVSAGAVIGLLTFETYLRQVAGLPRLVCPISEVSPGLISKGEVSSLT